MIYWFLKLIFGPIIRMLWIKDVYGKENIPKKGGLIIVANHASYLDFFILPAIFKRRIYFLAAEKFFRNFFWAILMRLTNQIRVDRTAKDKKEVYSKALKVLRENKILGIFPEGTRSRNGKLQRAFPGAVRISLMAKIPILPIGITGTYEILPRHKYFPNLKKCQVNIGNCISLEEYFGREEDDELLQKITDEIIMRKVADLIGRGTE